MLCKQRFYAIHYLPPLHIAHTPHLLHKESQQHQQNDRIRNTSSLFVCRTINFSIFFKIIHYRIIHLDCIRYVECSHIHIPSFQSSIVLTNLTESCLHFSITIPIPVRRGELRSRTETWHQEK